MSVPFERLNNLSAGIRNIVIAIALLVGGVWTAWTFNALDQIDKANAELQRSRAGQVNIHLSMSASQVTATRPDYRGVIVEIRVSNSGLVPVGMLLYENPLKISKVAVNGNGLLYATEIVELEAYGPLGPKPEDASFQPGLTVQAGSETYLSYYAEFRHPGIYMVDFYVPVEEKIRDVLREEMIVDVDSIAHAAAPIYGMVSVGVPNWRVYRFIELK